VNTSIPRPVGLPLDVTSWEQSPLVVRQWVVQLLASSSTRRRGAPRSTLACSSAPATPIVAPQSIRHTRSRQPALAGRAPWASPGAGGAAEVIKVTAQACSCGKAECPDPRSYYTHQVIERPKIQMPVSPLFLRTLLPLQAAGVLVRDARVRWQVSHPRSRWQALMTSEDRTSRRPEDLCTVGPSRSARPPSEPRPTRCGALVPRVRRGTERSSLCAVDAGPALVSSMAVGSSEPRGANPANVSFEPGGNEMGPVPC